MIKEHDRVILMKDLPAEGLVGGDVGTVVHIYPSGVAFEVEFMTLNGDTVAVVTIDSQDVREAGQRDLPHARELSRI